MSAGSVATWHDDSEVPKMEMLDACYRNDIQKVAECLKSGIPVDSTDDDLVTPLHIAAFNGNRELALLLLDSGADLEATSRTGMTAFHHASREGKMEVIDLLLQKGADIMRFTRMGASALTLAAAGGHLEVIKRLVGLRVPVAEAHDTCPTPLIAAVFRNFSPICVYLIAKGAFVDAAMENLMGLTALSCAVLLSNKSMLITLLEKGADHDKKSFFKRSPYDLALLINREDARKIFDQRSSGRGVEKKDVRQALMEDDYDPSDLLCERNNRLPSGCTAIHFSAAIGNARAVSILTDDGRYLDETEHRFGLSALQIAALLGQTDIISILLARGGSISYLNQQKMTAFDYYIGNGGETKEEIRNQLHCFQTKKSNLNLSASSGSSTLKRVLPVKPINMLSRKLFAEKPIELPPVEAKQWRETRMHTFPMHGRNYRKFVTVEELLFQERSIFPKRANSEDTVMEVIRGMASDATSFLVTNFYDWYSLGGERKPKEVGPKPKITREYDPAIANSNLYSYPKSQQIKPQLSYRSPIFSVVNATRRNASSASYFSSDSSDTWRKLKDYPETSSPNQSRQTPRILKRQKDSLMVEGEMRKSVSTGQLHIQKTAPRVVAPITMYADRPSFLQILANLRPDVLKILQDEELDEGQMLSFSEQNFKEVGVRDTEALHLLRDLQLRYRGPYRASNH